MAMVSFQFETEGLNEAINNFDGLAAGPSFTDIGKFESTFAEAAAAVNAAVHIWSGGLKASQTTETNFTGNEWTGNIELARHPGIFELARGDDPTANHPEGGHNFFDAAQPFVHKLSDDFESYVKDHIGTNPGAPGVG